MVISTNGVTILAECESTTHALREVAEFRGTTFDESCRLFAEAGWLIMAFRQIIPHHERTEE